MKSLIKNFYVSISSTNKEIFNIGLINLINGLLDLVKSILVVRIFGISREIEIYFASIVLIQTIDKIFIMGVTTDIFIPVYIKIKEKFGSFAAMEFFSVILNYFFLFGIFLILFLGITFNSLSQFLLPGFTNTEVESVKTFFFIILIITPIKIINGITSIPFRSDKVYTVHEKAGFINRVILILFILTLTDNYGTSILVYGILSGIFLRFIYTIYLFVKYEYKYQLVLVSKYVSTRDILKKLSAPMIRTAGLQLNRWITLAAFTLVTPGLFAIYKYVEQLFNNYWSIVTKALGTVFMTEISVHENMYDKKFISNFLNKCIFVSIISFVLSFCVGKELITLFWYSSKYGTEEINLAFIFFLIHTGMMFFNLLENVFSKMNISRGDIFQQFIGTFFINLLGSIFLLIFAEEYGVVAIIISGLFRAIGIFTLSISINFFNEKSKFTFVKKNELFKPLLQSFIISGVLYLFWVETANYIFDYDVLQIILSIIIKIIVFLILFILTNSLFKVYDFKKLLFEK